MLKKILLLLALLLVTTYLVLAITAFNKKPEGALCNDISLVIKDTAYAGFITKKEIMSMLAEKKLNPIGKELNRIDLDKLEKEIGHNQLIEEVECYRTPSGKICFEVAQRIPLLRVMLSNGEEYYIDNKGNSMPSRAKCIADVVIVTGAVNKSFAKEKLHKFGVYLQNNSFWNAQIVQLNVLPDNTIELVPRVGDQIIYLGNLDHYEEKLERVKEFYAKALNTVGWNKYKRINVEFSNQIICTK